MKDLIILSHDPSITAWGYSLIKHPDEIILSGCLSTKKETKKRQIRAGDDYARRLELIIQPLLRIIYDNKVNFMITEMPTGSQGASAAKAIGSVYGVLMTLKETLNLPLEWYLPGDCKIDLTGNKDASKDQIKLAISRQYIVPWTTIKYHDEAIADSIAVYHCAKIHSSTIKFFAP